MAKKEKKEKKAKVKELPGTFEGIRFSIIGAHALKRACEWMKVSASGSFEMEVQDKRLILRHVHNFMTITAELRPQYLNVNELATKNRFLKFSDTFHKIMNSAAEMDTVDIEFNEKNPSRITAVINHRKDDKIRTMTRTCEVKASDQTERALSLRENTHQAAVKDFKQLRLALGLMSKMNQETKISFIKKNKSIELSANSYNDKNDVVSIMFKGKELEKFVGKNNVELAVNGSILASIVRSANEGNPIIIGTSNGDYLRINTDDLGASCEFIMTTYVEAEEDKTPKVQEGETDGNQDQGSEGDTGEGSED